MVSESVLEGEQVILNLKIPLGQTVYSDSKNDFTGEYINTIDLGKEPKGIYFVEMILGNERRARKLILE